MLVVECCNEENSPYISFYFFHFLKEECFHLIQEQAFSGNYI